MHINMELLIFVSLSTNISVYFDIVIFSQIATSFSSYVLELFSFIHLGLFITYILGNRKVEMSKVKQL